MPYMVMAHDTDPKQKLLEEIGDISRWLSRALG